MKHKYNIHIYSTCYIPSRYTVSICHLPQQQEIARPKLINPHSLPVPFYTVDIYIYIVILHCGPCIHYDDCIRVMNESEYLHNARDIFSRLRIYLRQIYKYIRWKYNRIGCNTSLLLWQGCIRIHLNTFLVLWRYLLPFTPFINLV